MGWGLFALQPAKKKLFPFVRSQYTLAQYKTLSKAQPRVKSHAMQVAPDLLLAS